MPGGISLFLLWWAPVVAMAIGAVVGVVFYKQGVKRAGKTAFNGFRRLFFKESYKKYLRNQMMQYDKELSSGRLLGKRFKRGYVPRRPNVVQRGLQKAHIRRFEPRELKPREQEWRRKRMHHIKNYLEKHDRTSDAPYLDHSVKPFVEEKTSIESTNIPYYLSTKEYLKTPRHSTIAADRSIITTSNKDVVKKFAEITNKAEFKSKALKDETPLYNTLYVSTRDSKPVALESFRTKDSEVYYTISSDILKHLSTSVPEDIYPVKISRTIVKDGKEVQENRLYTRREVAELAMSYESKLGSVKKPVEELSREM